jgi:hypothetical protein
MFDEADVNHDGAVSYKEFCHILNHAEGKANAWGKLEQSLWHRAAKNVSDLSQLVVSKTAKDFARSHSYECADSGHLVPTAGIRFIAEIVGDCYVLCYAISIGLCSYLNNNAYSLHPSTIEKFLVATARDSGTEDLEFTKKAKSLATITIIVAIALNLFVRFFGKTVGFYLFGLETVNKASKKTANFFQMILFDPLTIIFLAITSYQYFFILKGRTSEQLEGDDLAIFKHFREWFEYSLYIEYVCCSYLLVTGRYPTEDLFGLQVVVKK